MTTTSFSVLHTTTRLTALYPGQMGEPVPEKSKVAQI